MKTHLPQSAVVSLFTYDLLGTPAFHASGFLVSADGLIATARHVIQNTSKVTAQTSDGREFTVLGVVAEDPVHDLVIVRIREPLINASI
jgi:S1-C subfamily serine protease